MCLITNDFYKAICPHVQDVRTDVLGNVIARREGRGKRIMLIAHQDVVRMMVTHIDNNGFLYIKPSGGIDVVVGIGMLFGIEMDENFRQPYFAVSISDFWHRWHRAYGLDPDEQEGTDGHAGLVQDPRRGSIRDDSAGLGA